MITRFAVAYTATGASWHYAVPGSERAICGRLVQGEPGSYRVTFACQSCAAQLRKILESKGE